MASTKPSTDGHYKLQNQEHENWQAVGEALSLMCAGLRPYIEREMKAFHQALLLNLRFVRPCSCPLRKHSYRSCAWAAQLAMYHGGTPKWHQSDSSLWTDPKRGYWEVAKLYMSDLGTSMSTVVDAVSTDCTGLINLVYWCHHFRLQVFHVETVRMTRNTIWAHSARQQLTDVEKADAFTAIRNLLQDPELVADIDAKRALAGIDKMEKEFDAGSAERKEQAEFRIEVGSNLSAIDSKMKDFNTANDMAQRKLDAIGNNQTKVVEILESTAKEDRENSSCTRKKIASLQNQQEEVLEVLKNSSCASKALSFLWLALTLFNTRCIQYIGSLKIRCLSVWIAALIFMGVIGYLNHNSFKDGCPWEDTNVSFHTKEYNFTSILETNREGFTGRGWLFQDILRLLLQKTQDHSVGGVLVVGEPGTGKSALTAQLICSRSSNSFIHRKIIGYHLCRFSDKATQNPGRFVRNLVDLIARRIPEYDLLVSSTPFILEMLNRHCLRDPHDCFEQAVVHPLHHLRYPYEDHFIVVDALDECSSDSGDGGTTIVRFIKDTFRRLPKWIKLIATSRNDPVVLRHFSATPRVHLSSKDARNIQDIEIFATTKLIQEPPFIERLQVMLGLRNGEGISHLTNLLLNQSEGNFLLVKEIIHFWTKNLHDDADFNKLPKTIGDTYESYFRREFGSREKFKSALSVLEVLVAALEPPQINRVFEVIKVREGPNYDYEYDFFYTLQRLQHFIKYGTDDTITLFHLSFTRWLTNRGNLGNSFYVSERHGHRRLAEYYLSVVKKASNSSMDIYRLAQHLSFLDLHSDDRHYLEEFRKIKTTCVNATIDKDSRTILHLVAVKSNRMVLRLVTEAFKNIDCKDNYGFTPAFVAAMSGLAENVELFLSRGAKIEHRTKPPQSLTFLLLQPIQRSKLLAYSNSTMLHAAALGGHTNIVRRLLKKNASFRDSNGVNLTAIQLAALYGHLDVVELLCQSGAPVDHTLLQLAQAGGHANVMKFVRNTGVKDEGKRCNTCLTMPNIHPRTYPYGRQCGSGDISKSDNRLTVLSLILCQIALYLLKGWKNRS